MSESAVLLQPPNPVTACARSLGGRLFEVGHGATDRYDVTSEEMSAFCSRWPPRRARCVSAGRRPPVAVSPVPSRFSLGVTHTSNRLKQKHSRFGSAAPPPGRTAPHAGGRACCTARQATACLGQPPGLQIIELVSEAVFPLDPVAEHEDIRIAVVSHDTDALNRYYKVL